MRYFALAVAVVLVGGYVVGQQPDSAEGQRPPNAISLGPSTQGWQWVRAADLPAVKQLVERKRTLGLIDSESHPGAADGERPTYVVGQQPDLAPSGSYLPRNIFGGAEDEFFVVGTPRTPDSAAAVSAPADHAQGIRPVGRFLPVGTDRLVDSTNGTMYRVEGDTWIEAVTMKQPKAARPTNSSDSVDGLDIDELLGKEGR